jgi:hypothetical protein
MALQSSGQIKLSEIATEFGGSAPHSLSEYYDKGNAPASGEIQLAADFYGTANGLSLNTTITFGEQTTKLFRFNRGFISSSGRTVGTLNDVGPNPDSTLNPGPTNTTAIGSLASTNAGLATVEAIYTRHGNGVTTSIQFEISASTTAWTNIKVTHSGTTFTYNRGNMTTSDNQLFTINTTTGAPFPSSGTGTFQINI